MVWTRIMSRLRRFISGIRGKGRAERAVFPDRETLQEYLGQIVQELNLRLLCREEGGFLSGKILWVQEITVTEYSEKHKAVRRKERYLLWR